MDARTSPAPATIDVSPAQKLRDEACAVYVTFSGHWPHGSRSLDADTKTQVAQAAGLNDARALSAGTLLYDSRHPLIKKGREMSSRVIKFRDSLTVPMAAQKADTAKESTGRPEMASGIKLIRRDQLEQFEQTMNAMKIEAKTVEAELNKNRDEILEASEAMLGGRFNPDNYPSEFRLDFNWGYPNVEPPSYLERLAPQAYQRELSRVRQQFEDSYELATMTLMEELQTVIASWCDRLGPVIKIYPPEGHDLHGLFECQVMARFTNVQDPSVPSGKMVVVVRLPVAKTDSGGTMTVGETVDVVNKLWEQSLVTQDDVDAVNEQLKAFREDDKAKKKSIDIRVGPINQTQYADLRPSEDTSTHKTFKQSTIENLLELIDKFRKLGSTVSASTELTAIVDAAAKKLARAGDAKQTCSELKDSRTFRGETHELMTQLSARLDQEVSEFTRRRRKIIKGVEE